MPIKFPENEKVFGCLDGPPPDTAEFRLSRILDTLTVLAHESTWDLRKKFWEGLPTQVKLDYNYSKWRYKAL